NTRPAAGAPPRGPAPQKPAIVRPKTAVGDRQHGSTGEPVLFAAPRVTKLPSGVTLFEPPPTQNAIVNVELRFRSGAVNDPPGKAGLTYLTARVMAEGG